MILPLVIQFNYRKNIYNPGKSLTVKSRLLLCWLPQISMLLQTPNLSLSSLSRFHITQCYLKLQTKVHPPPSVSISQNTSRTVLVVPVSILYVPLSAEGDCCLISKHDAKYSEKNKKSTQMIYHDTRVTHVCTKHSSKTLI